MSAVLRVERGAKKPRALPHSSKHPVAEAKDDSGHLDLELRGADTGYWRTVYRDMLKADISLFSKDILGIEIGPHLLSWGDLIDKHKRIAINAARDHSKSTFFSYAYPIWRAWSEPGCEVYIFSNTMEQAQEFLDIIIYGRNNLLGMVQIPELRHLVPDTSGFRDPRVRLNRSDARFTNTSRIRCVGYGKSIRGRHPKYIVLDDPLNDEDMWSETTRKKNIEYFKSAITNMLPPDGQLIVVGCVKTDTWVTTNLGLRRIGSLCPGELVPKRMYPLELPLRGKDGVSIATQFWVNGVEPTKRVTLRRGHVLEGTHRHPVWTRSGWKRMDALCVGDEVQVDLGAESWGPPVPLAPAIPGKGGRIFGLPDAVTPALAYLIGLYVANGSSEPNGRITITTKDEGLIRYLQDTPFGLPFASRDGIHWRAQAKQVFDTLAVLGLFGKRAHEKTVPDEIVGGPRDVAIAFLRGLYDADGTTDAHEASLASTSESVIRSVQAMLCNLGVEATVSRRPPASGSASVPRGTHDVWFIRASGPGRRAFADRVGFGLAGKQASLLNGTPGASSEPGRYWYAVEAIEDSESFTADFVVPDGHSFISNCIVSHNTPYHIADLYGFLRQNKRYCFRRYPGIIKTPEGEERALFPWRWKLEELKARREEIGSVSFAREILCEPITDDISIFPGYLFPPLYDPILKLRPTKEEIEQRGWTTYIGVDIARSASVGADYFVVFVIAKDNQGQHFIVDIRRTKGLPFNKQLEEIAIAALLYDPALIYIESNAMQQVYTDEMRRLTDLPVKEFVTLATNKYPLDKGVPGLRILMENQKLTIPRGDALSVRLTDDWVTECTQFGYVDGKLQGIGEHDDMVMAFWIAVEAARAGGFSFAFGESKDDASDDWEGKDDGESWQDVMLGPNEEQEETPFDSI